MSVERRLESSFMGRWTVVRTWWLTVVRTCNTDLASPQQGRKRMTSSPCVVHFVSAYICVHLLYHSWSFGGFLFCFQRFGAFFELVFNSDLNSRKKGNEVLTRVTFFGSGESKSECIQDDLLFTLRMTFACWLFWAWTVSDLFCQDATWPAFVTYWLGKWLFNLFMTTVLGTAIFYWLHFEYITNRVLQL